MNINDKIFDIRNKFMKNSKQYYVPGELLSNESSKLYKLISDINISAVPLQLLNIENLDDYKNVESIIEDIMNIYVKKMDDIQNNLIKNGSGMGGNDGNIFMAKLNDIIDDMLFKKFKNTTFLKKQNSTETIDIDNEVFTYLFFLELYNNKLKENIEDKNTPSYNSNSLSLLKDIVKNGLTLDMLHNKHATTSSSEPKTAEESAPEASEAAAAEAAEAAEVAAVEEVASAPAAGPETTEEIQSAPGVASVEAGESAEESAPGESAPAPGESAASAAKESAATKDILIAYLDKQSKTLGIPTTIKKQNYFTLGNLKKNGGDIIDYKIGCYTTNYSEKEINTILSCKDFICIQNTTPKTTQVTGGGNPFGIKIDKVKKLSKIYNDILSTSNQYGFRCEGTDDTFYKIFNKYMFLSYTNNYTFDMNSWKKEIKTNNEIGIFVPNDNVNNKYPKTYNIPVNKKRTKIFNPDKGYVDRLVNNIYEYPYLSQGKQSGGALFSTNYEKFILINKKNHFEKVQELFKKWSNNLLNVKINPEPEPNTKLDMMLNCIKLHFSYVSYFNYDNNVIKNTVSYKSSLFNKAPNYYLHPLILYDTFYVDYNNTQSTKLQDNLNTMVTNLFLNQFTAILKGESKVCVAFVGASIVTNLKTQDVRLIDFEHPVFFNAANLQYLVKHNSDNMLIPKSKQEDDKYRKIFSIFMNYLYGGLSYYFMLSVYLGKTDKTNNSTIHVENTNRVSNTTPDVIYVNNKIDDTFIKYLYYATYYTQGLAFGFPLIDDNNKLTSSVYYSKDEKKEGEYIDYLSELNILQPNYTQTNYTIEAKIKDLVTNIILPDNNEEQQFDTITSNNIPKTTLTKLRCDITKYNYQLRFKYAFNDNIEFNNSKYDNPPKTIYILPTVIFDIDYNILSDMEVIKPYHILMQRGIFKNYDIYINETTIQFTDRKLNNIVLIQTLQNIPNKLIKQINIIFEYINRGYQLIYVLYLVIFKCKNNNINYELDNDTLINLNSLFINFFKTINISMNTSDCPIAPYNNSGSNKVAETQCLKLQYTIGNLNLIQHIRYIKHKSGKYNFYVTHAEYTDDVFNQIINAYNTTRTALNTIVCNPFIILIIILISTYNNSTCNTKYIHKNYIIKYPQNNVFDNLSYKDINIYDVFRQIMEISNVINTINLLNIKTNSINYITTLTYFINEYIKFIDAKRTDMLRIMFDKIINLYNSITTNTSIVTKNIINTTNNNNNTTKYTNYFNTINKKLDECKEINNNTASETNLNTIYDKFITTIDTLLTQHNASNNTETVHDSPPPPTNQVSTNSVVTNNTNNVKQRLENFKEYSVFKRLANNNGVIFKSKLNSAAKYTEIYNIFEKFLDAAVIDENHNNLYVNDTTIIGNPIIVNNNATKCNAFFNNQENFKNLYKLYKLYKLNDKNTIDRNIMKNSLAYHPDHASEQHINEKISDNDKVLIKYFFTNLYQNIQNIKQNVYNIIFTELTYDTLKHYINEINEDILDYAYDNYIQSFILNTINYITNLNDVTNINFTNLENYNKIKHIISVLKYIINNIDTSKKQNMNNKYDTIKRNSLIYEKYIMTNIVKKMNIKSNNFNTLTNIVKKKVKNYYDFINSLFELKD